ncbi:MAG: hypothetical protein KatS3mg124_0308 [Porticoccaceae bacterium]|nr:MAG: hypothetical protein KatS3mg124_0308 [Porticoccaceae bacterium]
MDDELRALEAQLRARRTALLERLEEVRRASAEQRSPDWSEQAQERQNDEVLEGIRRETEQELKQVSLALERIAAGEYDLCSRCGERIPLARLRAVPYTSLCIECASRAG